MLEQERYKKLESELIGIWAGSLLERAAQKFPQTTAVMISPEKQITYRELYRAASQISHFIKQQGVKPRDRVIILYENSINFYIAYYGVWQTGAVVVPVNIFLEKELEHIIADAQPRMIFVSDEQANKLQSINSNAPIINQTQLEELAAGMQPAYKTEPLEQDEMAALLYTSGTTGTPKGVMLSSRNIITNVMQGACRFELTKQERVYCALPLFHSFTQQTCVWSTVALGATVILIPKILRSNLLAGLALKPTIVLGVPGLYGLFCRMRNTPFDDVRYFICGGDALVDKIRMYFELLYGRKLCNGYGLSETSPFVAVDLDDSNSTTSTVGRPCLHMQVEIRDENNLTLPHGTIGTLWVKGPNVMLGYYNAPEATAAVLKDGWLDTGDLAKIDAWGKIVICGREKDLIANKGIKIYPQEVENLLMSHPQVMLAAVIGVHNNSDEEFPVAYVMLKEDGKATPQELENYCRQNLAGYKIPRTITMVKQLPLTATGKVDKKELRKNHT